MDRLEDEFKGLGKNYYIYKEKQAEMRSEEARIRELNDELEKKALLLKNQETEIRRKEKNNERRDARYKEVERKIKEQEEQVRKNRALLKDKMAHMDDLVERVAEEERVLEALQNDLRIKKDLHDRRMGEYNQTRTSSIMNNFEQQRTSFD